MWCEELDGDRQSRQMLVERRADDAPVQPALAATERWNGERRDPPLVEMRFEVLQPLNDVPEAGNRAPVTFGREVEDVRRTRTPVQIRLAEPNPASLAALPIVLEHVRESVLELEGDALAHDADGVHRVDEGLSRRLEHVADDDLDARLQLVWAAGRQRKKRWASMVTCHGTAAAAQASRARSHDT